MAKLGQGSETTGNEPVDDGLTTNSQVDCRCIGCDGGRQASLVSKYFHLRRNVLLWSPAWDQRK